MTTYSSPAGLPATYHCDALAHYVVATDATGAITAAFGGFGAHAGAFDTPLDVIAVRAEFCGEVIPEDGPDALWLAVADYGNRRVQVFEPDGTFVGMVDGDGDAAFGQPCRLTWRAPFLEIEGVDGCRTRIHLHAALLASAAFPLPPI